MEKQHGLKSLRQALARMGSFKYALLAMLVGLGILLLPGKKQEVTEPEQPEIIENTDTQSDERRMENILSAVEGAGAVRVMLTTRNSGVTEYQTDCDTTENQTSRNTRTQTVFGGSDGALVKSVAAPQYLGALVVSEGAARKDVQLALVKAVCTLTGLGSNKVTVLVKSK